jgi:hypothetical protein
MKILGDLTIFEIKDRIEFLTITRDEIVKYFNDTSTSYTGLERSEGQGAVKLRSKINLNIHKAREYVFATGVNPYIYYTPPPMVGGHASNIDLFLNIFNLAIFQLDPRLLTDAIEQALGKYDNEQKSAIIRTFNPFWWLFKLIKSIAYFPFWILQSAGVNTTKFERSFFGKIIKLIFDLAVFIAAVLAILAAFGWQDTVINYIKNLSKIIQQNLKKPKSD